MPKVDCIQELQQKFNSSSRFNQGKFDTGKANMILSDVVFMYFAFFCKTYNV